jgi:2-keto-4-pentenoate hydratase
VAFVLKSDLMGPGVTAADVLRATDCVVPCFEIVDSRIQDWKIKIQDTVADNASCGVLVLGGRRKSPADIDLALAGMVLEKNGEIISTSTGAAVQGSPVNAVAWLANTLGPGHRPQGRRSDPVRFAIPAGSGQGRRQPRLHRWWPGWHLRPLHLIIERDNS